MHSLPVQSCPQAPVHQRHKDFKGGFLSSSSAQYRPALVQALPLQECASLQPVFDGAGRPRSADQILPNPLSPLKELSNRLAVSLAAELES